MSNNTQLAEMTNLAKGLAQSAQSSDAGGDGSFMKFTKFGEWVWGSEQTEVEDDALWAVHPQGFQHGWIAWGDKAHGTNGQKLGEEMVLATDPLPPKAGLPEVKGAWAQQISMQMVCLSGMDKGTKVSFNSCSMGGRGVYKKIVNAVVAQITGGASDVCPVVELTNDNYIHKEHGKIFTPVVNVDDWKSLAELNDILSDMEDDVDEAAEDASSALAQLDAESEAARAKAQAKGEAKAAKEAKAAEAKAAKAAEAAEPEAEEKPARRRRRRTA